MKPTTVLLADDHPTLMLGLVALLKQISNITVLAQIENGDDALAKISTLQPNVAVLDCKLPGLNGIQIAETIKAHQLPTQVLALSAYDKPQYLWGMFNAGASGYLLKEEAPTHIVRAVTAIASGEALWTPAQLRRIQRWQEQVQARWDGLTPREKEVLFLVAAGKKNKAIADDLTVSERTVEYHLTNILGKLELTSRSEAIVWVNKTLSDETPASN
jgi:DNA-binding NarL/FixJ family response regulator